MKLSKKRTSLIGFILIVIAIVLLAMLIIFFEPFKTPPQEVKSAEVISKESIFRKNFIPPTPNKTVKLSCSGIEGCPINSPISPFKRLMRSKISDSKVTYEAQDLYGDFANGYVQNNRVYYDPYWEVYFVNSNDLEFYGPYKLSD